MQKLIFIYFYGEKKRSLTKSSFEDVCRWAESLSSPFAFSIEDPHNQSIFCARDPLGVAPLYYTETADGYRFASDVGELLTLRDEAPRPNYRAMRTLLKGFAVDYHETMYEGIYRLPPGHRMIIDGSGRRKIERYWFPEKIERDYSLTEEEAARKLKTLLKQAVERSIGSVEETAFELSGGLDSSSVVSLMAQSVPPQSLDTYSMSCQSRKCNEDAYVDAMLERYPLSHRKIPIDHLDYRDAYSMERLYHLSPHWPVTLTFAMLLPMLETMQAEGKRIVVSGQGGDHLFTGTPYVLYDLFMRGETRAFWNELRSYRRGWPALKNYLLRPLLGERNVDRIKRLMGRKTEKSYWEEKEIVDLTEELGLREPCRKWELDTITSAYHATVMDGNIFHCAERHFGLEYRHPFFDRELVEFVLSLPPEMKYADRTIKRILREAMEGILPEKIRQRRDKAEFSEILIQQIDVLDLDGLLGKRANIVRLGLIPREAIDECLDGYAKKHPVHVSRLWAIVNVEYWYRYNFGEEGERER